MAWEVFFTRQAQKDARKVAAAGLKQKAEVLLDMMARDPFLNPPPYEKLVGDLDGFYSRRINIQHRLVYQVLKKEKAVKVLRLWTHYE
jgi:toxin YoeB